MTSGNQFVPTLPQIFTVIGLVVAI